MLTPLIILQPRSKVLLPFLFYRDAEKSAHGDPGSSGWDPGVLALCCSIWLTAGASGAQGHSHVD